MNENEINGIPYESICEIIKQAIDDYHCDGYTQHCVISKCPNCGENLIRERDMFDYISEKLRENWNELWEKSNSKLCKQIKEVEALSQIKQDFTNEPNQDIEDFLKRFGEK